MRNALVHFKTNSHRPTANTYFFSNSFSSAMPREPFNKTV